jgi:hypothetical protein
MSSSEQWLPSHKAFVVYANNRTYNRPALILLEVNVCVVGGFPFNLVLLTRARILITIDQPVEPVAMQAGFSSCIAAKSALGRALVAAHGRTVHQLAHETLSAYGGHTQPPPKSPTPF